MNLRSLVYKIYILCNPIEVAGKKDLIRKSLAVGIIFFFIVSSVGSIGLETKDVDIPPVESVDDLMNSGWSQQDYNSYHVGFSPFSSVDNLSKLKLQTRIDGLIEDLPNTSNTSVVSFLSKSIIYVDDDNTEGPWEGTIEHPYQFIQDGIDNSSPGDTVYVYNGLYVEHINVNKMIKLISEDKNYTIIDGGSSSHVVIVTNDWITVNGFTIQGGGSGEFGFIKITSNYNVISNNILISGSPQYGLLFKESSFNLIYNNLILDRSYGIWITGKSVNNEIFRNTVQNCRISIGLQDVVPVTTIKDNIIHDNSISGSSWDGIWLNQADNTTVYNNSIYLGDQGIWLRNSKDCRIFLNDCSKNYAGIVLDWSDTGGKVFWNLISENNYGIGIVGEWDAIFYGNNIIQNDIQAEFLDASLFGNRVRWLRNYWDDWRKIGPYRIEGENILLSFYGSVWSIPWINFDWFPRLVPNTFPLSEGCDIECQEHYQRISMQS